MLHLPQGTGIQRKPLKHKAIPGFLSAVQIAPHHTAHYGGALKGYTAADSRIESGVKSGEQVDAAAYGALKRAVNSKGNSVVLHEFYFDGLAPQAPDPAAHVRSAIEMLLPGRVGIQQLTLRIERTRGHRQPVQIVAPA